MQRRCNAALVILRVGVVLPTLVDNLGAISDSLEPRRNGVVQLDVEIEHFQTLVRLQNHIGILAPYISGPRTVLARPGRLGFEASQLDCFYEVEFADDDSPFIRNLSGIGDIDAIAAKSGCFRVANRWTGFPDSQIPARLDRHIDAAFLPDLALTLCDRGAISQEINLVRH